MTIPVVFPYRSSTSKWEELKYAIRSFEKYFKDKHEIWVIGNQPEYLTSNRHIIPLGWFKFQDGHTKNKNCNINNKFLFAANLFEEFIWVSDDQLLLTDMWIKDFKKIWYLENIQDIQLPSSPTPWQRLLINTYQIGIDNGYDANYYNFESHLPLYVQSKYVSEVQEVFNVASGNTLFKQAYGMVVSKKDPEIILEFANEVKLGIYNTLKNVDNYPWNSKKILSFDDKGLKTPRLKEKIKSLYPTKSSLETRGISKKPTKTSPKSKTPAVKKSRRVRSVRNMDKNFNKVFGVGMPKTGTTSLADAFRRMGFRTKHYSMTDNFDNIDMACDFPVQARFRKLDKKYPGSKFILTIRDEDSWLKSYENHLKDREKIDSSLTQRKLTQVNRLRAEMYGTHRLNLKLLKRRKDEHEQEVKEYFKDRPNDLLIIDITDHPDPFKEICDFLGVKKVPEISFPHKNKSKHI